MTSAGSAVSTVDGLAHYANGWFVGGEASIPDAPLKWENPEVRCIVDLRGRTWKRYMRNADRVVRNGGFELRFGTAFSEVVRNCAVGRSPGESTWLDASISDLYRRLHAVGAAYSAEAWLDGHLVGGVLGLVMGRWISIESLFHSAQNAGHAAVAAMAQLMEKRGCVLLDVQDLHPFTRQLGGVEIPRDAYLRLLRAALDPTLAASAGGA